MIRFYLVGKTARTKSKRLVLGVRVGGVASSTVWSPTSDVGDKLVWMGPEEKSQKSEAAVMPTLLTRGSVSRVQLSERCSQFWLEQRVYFGEK